MRNYKFRQGSDVTCRPFANEKPLVARVRLRLMRLFTAIRTQQWHLWFPWAVGITRVTQSVPYSGAALFIATTSRWEQLAANGIVFS